MFRKISNLELNRLNCEEFKTAKKTPLCIVLDNVRSQHNIGSCFRTSDAFLIEKLYLCGISATPPSTEIHKSALGAEFSVDWEYYKKTEDVINLLKEKGYIIISVEQAENSSILGEFKIDPNKKYAVVFGNEVKGIQQEVINMSHACLEIPQYGTKHSLNVSVAIGIVIWDFYKQIRVNL